MALPRNIIIIIADSLRYDNVFAEGGTGLNYVEPNAIVFHEARSGGCWTLPATASMFTGMLPHEHGATEQTRGIRKDIPTLAENMKKAGYKTYQVTANVATTHIFGLERGFDELHRVWQMVEAKFSKIQLIFGVLGKPRLREKIMSKDFLAAKMSEDMEVTKTWLQLTYPDTFKKTRQIIAENEAKGERSFIFVNLMETHFPYHVAPTLEMTEKGLWGKWQEVTSLYHMANQTFLKKGFQNISERMLNVLKGRQRLAWQSLAPAVDDFCRELHEDTGNLVIFGADHGENFGEQGWSYHFSNVTDAGTKVPLFWLNHDGPVNKQVNEKVSAKDLYHTLSQMVGVQTPGPNLLTAAERSYAVMQSYWYNNKGQTKEKYKYNQMSVIDGEERYLLRNGVWHQGKVNPETREPEFAPTPGNANPVEELVQDPDKKAELRNVVKNYEAFAAKIKF